MAFIRATSTMPILQIRDSQPSKHDVVVDLRDVLPVLGQRALLATWRVAGVARYDEDPMVVGDEAAERLEALHRSQDMISGVLLSELVDRTVQIIWGEFRAYKDGGTEPWVIVRAIDSTWCEVETDDEDVLDILRRSFTDVRTPA